MKEYTILSIISVILALAADNLTGVKLTRRKIYYLLIGCLFFFMIFVNGYLTKYIVRYNERFFLGIRLGTIPVEDFLFGFSMITMTIIFWEVFKKEVKP